MSRHELSRGNKSLWQRVETLVRSTLPRQAFVTSASGGSVWVRFIDEGTGSPESKFPSTVAGVAAGTVGWVITLGGKKGLFVATGILTPKVNSNSGLQTLSISSAGDYPFTNVAVSIPGLPPGMNVKVIGDVMIRVIGTGSGGNAVPGFTVTNGSSTTTTVSAQLAATTAGQAPHPMRRSLNVVVPSNGIITLTPITRWTTGTYVSSYAEATLEVWPT